MVYTRYADDVFLSTDKPYKLSSMLETIESKLVEDGGPVLRINDKKTVFTSRKRQRVITGIVLTSDCVLSIGRKKKRGRKPLLPGKRFDVLIQINLTSALRKRLKRVAKQSGLKSVSAYVREIIRTHFEKRGHLKWF